MIRIYILLCPFVLLGISMLMLGCAPDDKKVAEHVKAGITVLDSNIRVDVKEGVVSLSGTVMDESTKNAAESAVKEIKGVKSVTNNITIKEQVSDDEPGADDRLRQSIYFAFKSNNIQGVSINVDNGEVTLTGEVKKADLVKAVKAVNEARPKRVINQLKTK